MGSTQEVVLPAEEHQPEEESTENEDPNKSLLEETASLFAADIASMMSENQTEETEPEAAEQEEENEEPEEVDQTQPVVLERSIRGGTGAGREETGDAGIHERRVACESRSRRGSAGSRRR